MKSSRDDTAVLIVAVVVILLLVGGGLLFMVRRTSALRGMAEAQRARAMEMESRVRLETLRAEQEAMAAANQGNAQGVAQMQAENDRLKAQLEALKTQAATEEGRAKRAELRKTILGQEASLAEAPLKDDPSGAAAVHVSLGDSYLLLGELDNAERHFKVALEYHRKLLGEESAEAKADQQKLDLVAEARKRR